VKVLYERVAGLDIGKATLAVCVRSPGVRSRKSEVRTYPTTTRALQVMRDWLLAEGVTIAAMESTSTYGKAPFYCLEEVMVTWLVNAAHIKAIRRPKTDVRDSEWIAQLLVCGLLRPSFVPPVDIRRLRMLTRDRVQLQGDRTREVTRLELRRANGRGAHLQKAARRAPALIAEVGDGYACARCRAAAPNVLPARGESGPRTRRCTRWSSNEGWR
jgi:transposase